MCVCVCVCVCVCACVWRERKREKERERIDNKVIQQERLIEEQRRQYSVSVLMNHHQDWEGWY